MARSASSDPLQIQLDPEAQAQLVRDIRNYPDELRKATRKRLREAAAPGVKDVQEYLLAGPSKQARPSLRSGLAAGTKVSIRTGKLAGVAITTTAAKLQPSKKPMLRAYNKPSFRRRVFGGPWVEQKGRPYFEARLSRHSRGYEAAVEQALVDAAQTIRAGVVNKP